MFKLECVVPENIHTPPTEGIGNCREGEGGGHGGEGAKAQKFKAMYEAKLEFPRGGWGGHRANSFHGGRGRMDFFFYNCTISKNWFLKYEHI